MNCVGKNLCQPKVTGGSRATALSCAAADGSKLPPLLTVKDTTSGLIATKELPRINALNVGRIVVNTQENAWCDGDVMLSWVKLVLLPYCKSKYPKRLL